MMVLPTLIVLWAVIVALLTVPAFWKGEQPELEDWTRGIAPVADREAAARSNGLAE